MEGVTKKNTEYNNTRLISYLTLRQVVIRKCPVEVPLETALPQTTATITVKNAAKSFLNYKKQFEVH